MQKMSSDMYIFDGSFCNHSSPEMVSSDTDFFFSESFPPFCYSSSIDILEEFPNNQNTQNPVHNSNSTDNYSPTIISSSPPSHQLESLTLYQLQPPENSSNLSTCASFANKYANFSDLEALDVKTEECQVGFESSYNHHHQSFMPHSYSGVENVAKMMQRSYSSNSFDGKPDFLFQPRFDTLMESPDYQNHAFSSTENTSLACQMRRTCSTGDLQNIRTTQTTQRSFSSPLASENSFMEEANFKVGRYSAEERKERISKYRAKRNQRNFAKTIKYACRKTLADNRPRIRGRFARNEETGDIPKAACNSTRDEDEDELWFDGLHEEEDMRGSVGYVNSCSAQQQQQFQCYGYGF